MNLFGEWVKRFEKAGKESTAKTYRSILGKFESWLERNDTSLDEFTAEDIRNYLKNSNYKPKTQEDIIGCLKLFAKWYKNQIDWSDIQKAKEEEQRMNEIRDMIRPNVPKRQRRKALRLEEIEKLLDGMKVKNGSFLFLACYFGFRASEMKNIEEIDYDKGELRVLGEKDLIERVLPFMEKVGLVLRKAEDRGWLDRSYNSVWRAFKARRNILNGVKLTPHSGRHTFRSEMAREIDESLLDTILGHGENKIKNIYDDPAYEFLQEAMCEKHYLKGFEIPEVLKR